MNKLVRAKKIAHNPVAGLKELEHIPEKERRALTIAEAEELMKQSPKHWRDIWRFFMVSGMRHDELVEFQFSDIDYDRKIATVQKKNAKSKKAREIPLEDFVLADLREREKLAKHRKPARGVRGGENFSQDHVFVTRQNTPRKNNVLRQFYAFAKKAGIKDAHPNGSVDIQALRVTFTTWMINGNASPKAVQKILGHSTLELTMGIYTKANDASKHEALLQHPLSRVVVREGIHPEQMTIDLFQELFDGLIKTNLSQEESLDILSKAGFAFAFMNANLPKVNATKRN
ncbi:MAG: hypothetical protein COA78_17120 [Blastopirellula sp.]|nr:MAG: hypothetical protein COA78_17120 [Blastopirellula sp.]